MSNSIRIFPDPIEPKLLKNEVILEGEIGGRFVLEEDGSPVLSFLVGGPRKLGGQHVGRWLGKLRATVVRIEKGSPPPFGGDEMGAIALIRDELRWTNALFGQCGISFGDPSVIPITFVDPPDVTLVSIGCDFAQPASGGKICLKVGERQIELSTRRGQLPSEVASELARQVRSFGMRPILYTNPRGTASPLGSVDLQVSDKSGSLLGVAKVKGQPLSSDPTLGLCIGAVELADGLEHFTDSSSAVGTLEERALLRACLDADPTTIDLIFVPAFGRTGRIGESFIYADQSGIGNAVILDRAGLQAGAKSFALAHEMGHVLLNLGGHPDDFGVDQPHQLMDSDAADATEYGPRRLSLADCTRALNQSGPSAPIPLLMPSPFDYQSLSRPARRVPPGGSQR